MSLEVRTIPESQYGFINASDLSDEDLGPSVRQMASALSGWMASAKMPAQRHSGGLFDRNTYVVPQNPLMQMVLARKAVQEDDMVGGIADAVEGLMFQGAKWEAEDADAADVFNQVAADIDLDAFMRSCSRELYTCSQVVVATWWERKSYTVRGFMPPDKPTKPPLPGVVPETPKKGRPRRKTYDVTVPSALTILDSTRVIPVGHSLWGHDRLAWHASPGDLLVWGGMEEGPLPYDATMAQLIIGRYVPDTQEAAELSRMGVDPQALLELNPARVWRHCLTKPSYDKWPDNRLRSVFRLLDLKSQLMEADRVLLIGAANYILLVKKGSKEEPAYQEEIDNLKRGFTVLAKLPVIVSDHRLEIQIITPATDHTLEQAKYDVLDRRILARLLGSMSVAGPGAGARDTTLTVGRMVARLLESRRHMLKRAIESHVAKAIVTANPSSFTEEPNLSFIPRQIQLDLDPQVVQAILALRTQKELSRESTLEFFGFDQAVEAMYRELEEATYDPIFQTAVPFNAPANNAGGMPPGATKAPADGAVHGASGGRPTGGGKPKANGTTKTGGGDS